MTAEFGFDLLSVTALLPLHRMHVGIRYNRSDYPKEYGWKESRATRAH